MIMIICLLLSAPFILGVTAGPPEAEIPTAHSVYRVNGSSRKAYIRREKRLLSLEDTDNFPTASLDKDTGRISSSVPCSSVNKVQGSKSKLAFACRKLLKACEPSLSKTAIRKLLRPLFPSHSQVKRVARNLGCTREDVRSGILIRQQALHSTIMAWTFAGPTAEQAALETKLTAEKTTLTRRLVKLKGYKSLSDKRPLHRMLPEFASQSEIAAIKVIKRNRDKVEQIFSPAERLVSKERAYRVSSVFPGVSAPDIEGEESKTILSWVNTQCLKAIKPLRETISNNREAEQAAWDTSELVVTHKADERTIIHSRLQKIEWIIDNIYETYVAAPSTTTASLAFGYDRAPWTDYSSAKGFLSTVYVESMIEQEWAFFADPAVVVLPRNSSPRDLGAALGSQYKKGIPAVTIPRKANPNHTAKSMMEQTMEVLTGLNIDAGLSLYSATKGDNLRTLDKSQLVTQWLDSSIVLEAPSGVEEQLGIAWNHQVAEATWYTETYEGKNILFAPTKQESQKAQVQSDFDKLMADMGL